MPTIETLKRRLAETLRAKNFKSALGALKILARKEPKIAAWPRRAARLFHATSDFESEIVSLRRALELQVDQGSVLDAITSCKAILALSADDRPALETLELLYMNEASTDLGSALRGPGHDARTPRLQQERSNDAPLEALLLTDVVPGARSVQLGDAEPGNVSEIPIESVMSADEGEIPDLRLDQWSPSKTSEDLRAAQAMSLPTPADVKEIFTEGGRERGASLRSELANTPLFGELEPASLHSLIRRVRIVTLDAGQVLFRQGDAANSLYVIVDGAIVPIAEGEPRKKLAVLERGEFFGEIGLMTKQPRGATIEALVDTKLLAIDRRVLWDLIADEPSVAKSLLRFLRARLVDRQIRTNLLFAAFAHAERKAVVRQFRILEVQDGVRVVEQGKVAEGLFVVLTGSLIRFDSKEDKELGQYKLGDVFGGLSLLEGQVATADVRATGKCWLVVLGEGRFRRILEANPRLGRIIRRLAKESTSGEDLLGDAEL
ncbi:MAG TPA: cyclic nucleotide-binding domain-containing protein [Myxococcales bacterium]|nr:cyclic nucleotide-binding domain-containing protein [Myxococcales bacterium]HIK86444.1 cyclic nucleotide-binding domain-containing protein [Myxococcales bacterium]